MSIVGAIRGARGKALIPRSTDPGQVDSIAAEIARLDRERAILRAARPLAAHDVVAGIAGADALVADIDTEVGGLDRRLGILADAMTRALEVKAETVEQERARKRSTAINTVRRHLDQRTQAAEALTAAISAAVLAYSQLVEQSRLASAALPDAVEGGLFAAEKLAAMVEREISRLSGTHGPGAFPVRRQAYLGNLNDVVPLPETLAKSAAGVIEQVARPPAPERSPTRRYFSGTR